MSAANSRQLCGTVQELRLHPRVIHVSQLIERHICRFILRDIAISDCELGRSFSPDFGRFLDFWKPNRPPFFFRIRLLIGSRLISFDFCVDHIALMLAPILSINLSIYHTKFSILFIFHIIYSTINLLEFPIYSFYKGRFLLQIFFSVFTLSSPA